MTKLVVCDNHTLGYIEKESRIVNILHGSILKGATFELNPTYKFITQFDDIRLASKKDFEDFNVYFGAFRNHKKYLYNKNH